MGFVNSVHFAFFESYTSGTTADLEQMSKALSGCGRLLSLWVDDLETRVAKLFTDRSPKSIWAIVIIVAASSVHFAAQLLANCHRRALFRGTFRSHNFTHIVLKLALKLAHTSFLVLHERQLCVGAYRHWFQKGPIHNYVVGSFVIRAIVKPYQINYQVIPNHVITLLDSFNTISHRTLGF